MRRPHRSIETFDISLMAVVTKAMGAFLVLMLLLMPYYSRSPLGKDEALSLARKVRDADEKIAGVLGSLGAGDNNAILSSVREDLGSGQKLIDQLKRSIDQLNSQSARLAERIAVQAQELEQLKTDKTRMSERIAQLEQDNKRVTEENTRLKKEVEDQKVRIGALEKEIEDLKKKMEAMSAPVPTQPQLLARIAQLEAENADLRARMRQLQVDNTALRSQLTALQQQLAELQQRNSTLETQNSDLRAKASELQRQINAFAKSTTVSMDAQVFSCRDAQFAVGIFSRDTVVRDSQSKYVFDRVNSMGPGFPSYDSDYSVGKVFIASDQYREALPGKFFLLLLHRQLNPNGDATGRLIGKLRLPREECLAVVRLTISNSETARRFVKPVRFDTENAVEYFSTLLIGDDLSIKLEPPDDEGRAWVADQIAHATFADPDGLSHRK